MEQVGVNVSELDILDGNPPCSAFSMDPTSITW